MNNNRNANNNDTSPSKASAQKRGSQLNGNSQRTPTAHNQAADPKELFFGLTEREIQIENLKTIVVSQDQKLKVLDSVREDLQIAREQLRDSELNRGLLQQQLKENADRAREEAEKNKKYQDTLLQETRRL